MANEFGQPDTLYDSEASLAAAVRLFPNRFSLETHALVASFATEQASQQPDL